VSRATELAEEKILLNKTTLGFWLYLMTDCILFATLFATYMVSRNATASGPGGADIFDMPLVLVETIILLTSSFTCGLALIALKERKTRRMVIAFAVTFVLGVTFLSIEIWEFIKLINEGYGPQRSAFLSAFFTLVGAHGLHIFIGLIWMAVLIGSLYKRGLSPKLTRQFTLFGLFWHFLDLVWIFIFTFVYLMGIMK
jgi:cytochrome o ubiquinol oxidase subunit 3